MKSEECPQTLHIPFEVTPVVAKLEALSKSRYEMPNISLVKFY